MSDNFATYLAFLAGLALWLSDTQNACMFATSVEGLPRWNPRCAGTRSKLRVATRHWLFNLGLCEAYVKQLEGKPLCYSCWLHGTRLKHHHKAGKPGDCDCAHHFNVSGTRMPSSNPTPVVNAEDWNDRRRLQQSLRRSRDSVNHLKNKLAELKSSEPIPLAPPLDDTWTVEESLTYKVQNRLPDRGYQRERTSHGHLQPLGVVKELFEETTDHVKLESIKKTDKVGEFTSGYRCTLSDALSDGIKTGEFQFDDKKVNEIKISGDGGMISLFLQAEMCSHQLPS